MSFELTKEIRKKFYQSELKEGRVISETVVEYHSVSTTGRR